MTEKVVPSLRRGRGFTPGGHGGIYPSWNSPAASGHHFSHRLFLPSFILSFGIVPANSDLLPPGGQLRRVLLAVAVLTAALTVGCSRQTPHVGEWETEIHGGRRNVIWGGEYVFLADGDIRFVRRSVGKPDSVDIGRYKIDDSQDPIRIDIQWANGKSEVGILRFVGNEKRLMEMELATLGSKERPASFGGDTMLLTKKVKK